MLKKIWQNSPYFFLSAAFLFPALSYAEILQGKATQQTSSADKPHSATLSKNSPWQKMNIFAQLTGIWEKPAKTKSKLPVLVWQSEQGGNLELSLSPKAPLGSAQAVSVQISSDFFSCTGEPLRLWFTTQEYIDLSAPICDQNEILNQKSSAEEGRKMAEIMNRGGFPVLLSQANLAVIVRSQLAPKEVSAISWYRRITNPKFNKDLLGERK